MGRLRVEVRQLDRRGAGQGREGACRDATYIKDTLKAFAVVGGKNTPGSSARVFAECAAERKLMTFGAAPYYPETWYKKYHPYAWGGVMECERISYQLAEYIGKRLAERKAKWAGDTMIPEPDAQVRHLRARQRRLPVLRRTSLEGR